MPRVKDWPMGKREGRLGEYPDYGHAPVGTGRVDRSEQGRLRSDGFDGHIHPKPPCEPHELLDWIDLIHVDGYGAKLSRPLQPLGNPINSVDCGGPEELSGQLSEKAHWPATKNCHYIPCLDLAVLGGHVAGREDVSQKDDLLVSQSLGDLLESGVCQWHADVLGLRPVELNAEGPAPLTSAGLIAPAQIAAAAGGSEGGNHSVADGDPGDSCSDLLHDANEFVPHGVG